jgi:hypothetical protein
VTAGHPSAGAVTLEPLAGLVSYDTADTTVAGRGAVAAIRLSNLG